MSINNLNEITEKIKYQLVFNLVSFFFGGILISSLFLLFSKEIILAPNLMAVLMFGIALVYIKLTKNYKVVAIFCSSFALLILSYTFLIIKASQFLSPLWMVLNIVFAFFLVGRYWGLMILSIHFLIYYYFVIHVEKINLVLPSQFSFYDSISFTIQLSLVATSIGYILFQYLKAIRLTELKLKEVNLITLEKNELISKQVKEMELMLKEIHHRVKNNLQIVSSLLRLQSESLDEHQGSAFKEAIHRISAMSMIHEKMYQTNSLSDFDMKKYIESLTENVIENYITDKIPALSVDIQIKDMQSKTIVPFALLLNELLLNSVKHAFTLQETPKINIFIYNRIAENEFYFEYFDNGKWKQDSKPSFGSEIIQAMTDQLEGEFSFNTNEDGTKYIFKLKQLY